MIGAARTVPGVDYQLAVDARGRLAIEEEFGNIVLLGALREVEDGLSGLRLLAQQAAEQANSVESAQRAADLSGTRYRAGYVNYLEVIDAERQVLATRRAATQIERERALATVALIRALGGGWEGAPKLAANMEKSLR